MESAALMCFRVCICADTRALISIFSCSHKHTHAQRQTEVHKTTNTHMRKTTKTPWSLPPKWESNNWHPNRTENYDLTILKVTSSARLVSSYLIVQPFKIRRWTSASPDLRRRGRCGSPRRGKGRALPRWPCEKTTGTKH